MCARVRGTQKADCWLDPKQRGGLSPPSPSAPRRQKRVWFLRGKRGRFTACGFKRLGTGSGESAARNVNTIGVGEGGTKASDNDSGKLFTGNNQTPEERERAKRTAIHQSARGRGPFPMPVTALCDDRRRLQDKNWRIQSHKRGRDGVHEEKKERTDTDGVVRSEKKKKQEQMTQVPSVTR